MRIYRFSEVPQPGRQFCPSNTTPLTRACRSTRGLPIADVQYWMENIQKHATPNVHKCLVGNKRDMPNRAVSSDDGQAAAEHFGVKHFECSAKNGHNVEHVFHSMAADIVKTQLERAAAKALSGSPDTGAASASPGLVAWRCATYLPSQ